MVRQSEPEADLRSAGESHRNQFSDLPAGDGFARNSGADSERCRTGRRSESGCRSDVLYRRPAGTHQPQYGRFRPGHRIPSSQMKIRPARIAVLAFIGMVDALYLSIKRNAGPIPCHVTRGCTDVLTSKYSEVAGIPLSWFGLAFYFAIFSLVIFTMFEDPEHRLSQLSGWIFYLAGAALIISAFLVGIQAFILKEIGRAHV